MVDNKIILTKEIKDENIKIEIENFKFFVQYENLKDLENYKDEIVLMAKYTIQLNIN